MNLDEPTPLTFSLGLYATRSRVSSRSECVIVVKKTIILRTNVQKPRFFCLNKCIFKTVAYIVNLILDLKRAIKIP
uniref:Uncharacterized protein n=1 Tax=Trichogramma kaykai TaxID=54128 RepID=A0ABD2XHI5_9HYME